MAFRIELENNIEGRSLAWGPRASGCFAASHSPEATLQALPQAIKLTLSGFTNIPAMGGIGEFRYCGAGDLGSIYDRRRILTCRRRQRDQLLFPLRLEAANRRRAIWHELHQAAHIRSLCENQYQTKTGE
jgi:hypothetical protein